MDIRIKPLRPNISDIIPKNIIGVSVVAEKYEELQYFLDANDSFLNNLLKEKKRDEEMILETTINLAQCKRNIQLYEMAWKDLQTKILGLPDLSTYVEKWKKTELK